MNKLTQKGILRRWKTTREHHIARNNATWDEVFDIMICLKLFWHFVNGALSTRFYSAFPLEIHKLTKILSCKLTICLRVSYFLKVWILFKEDLEKMSSIFPKWIEKNRLKNQRQIDNEVCCLQELLLAFRKIFISLNLSKESNVKRCLFRLFVFRTEWLKPKL